MAKKPAGYVPPIARGQRIPAQGEDALSKELEDRRARGEAAIQPGGYRPDATNGRAADALANALDVRARLGTGTIANPIAESVAPPLGGLPGTPPVQAGTPPPPPAPPVPVVQPSPAASPALAQAMPMTPEEVERMRRARSLR